jgi:hypothetical protein
MLLPQLDSKRSGTIAGISNRNPTSNVRRTSTRFGEREPYLARFSYRNDRLGSRAAISSCLTNVRLPIRSRNDHKIRSPSAVES